MGVPRRGSSCIARTRACARPRSRARSNIEQSFSESKKRSGGRSVDVGETGPASENRASAHRRMKKGARGPRCLPGRSSRTLRWMPWRIARSQRPHAASTRVAAAEQEVVQPPCSHEVPRDPPGGSPKVSLVCKMPGGRTTRVLYIIRYAIMFLCDSLVRSSASRAVPSRGSRDRGGGGSDRLFWTIY